MIAALKLRGSSRPFFSIANQPRRVIAHMPHRRFQVKVLDWTEVHELPGAWPNDKLRQVFELAEFEEPVASDELADMVLMLLQDLKPRPAAELVLEVVFGAAMRPGVRQNIAEELQDDKPWEDHAEVFQQAGIFEAVVLLQRAFPAYFDVPDAVRMHVEVQATDAQTEHWLNQQPSPAFLLRLLAGGMDQSTALHRLFGDELRGDQFSAADGILWRIDAEPVSNGAATRGFTVYSTHRWLEPLREHTEFTAAAWPDRS